MDTIDFGPFVYVVEKPNGTTYYPPGAPSDKDLALALDICQGGAYIFHKALGRLGRPQHIGEA